MPNEELIDEYVDRAAVADDTKFLEEQLKSVLSLFEKVKGIKIDLHGATGLKDITEGAKQAQKALDEMNKSANQILTTVEKIEKAEAKTAATRSSQKGGSVISSTPVGTGLRFEPSDSSNFARAPLAAQDNNSSAFNAAVELATAKELVRVKEEELKVSAKIAIADTANVQAIELLKAQLKDKNSENKISADLIKAEANSIDLLVARNKLLISEQKKLNTETDSGKKRLEEINKEIVENKARIKEITTAGTTSANVGSSTNLEDIIREREARRQLTAEIKNRIREETNEEGSIERKRAALIRLQKQYDKLNAAARKSDDGQKLKASIKSLSDELLKLEGETGRFQRNVGNYANAFSSAFDDLENEVKNIRKQMSDQTISPEMLQKFAQQEMALEQILQNLNKNFASTSAQSSAFKEAVKQVGVAFGQQSKLFEDFKNKVGEGVDALKDLGDAVKQAASDTKLLDQIIGFATALAGSFSLVTGIMALTGKESEALNKTLVKLQAVMAVLAGLQALQNELKNKDSILSKLRDLFIRKETEAIKAQAAAQTANAAATNKAATAVKGFGFALKSIGIGLILSLIPIAAVALSNMGRKARTSEKDLKELGETTKEIAGASIKSLDDHIKSLNESLGKTSSEIDKARKALKLLQNELKVDTWGEAFDETLQLLTDGTAKWSMERKEKFAQADLLIKQIENASQLERLQKLKTFLTASRETLTDAQKNINDLEIDGNNRSLTLLKKRYTDLLLSQKDYVAQSDALLKGNLEAEKKTIQATLSQDIANAGKDVNKKKAAQNNANKALILAERNYLTARQELLQQTSDDEKTRSYKDRQTMLDVLKLRLEGQIDYYKEVSALDVLYAKTRAEARQKAFELEKQIIQSERNVQLSAEKLTAADITKINEQANNSIRKAEESLYTDLLGIASSYRVKLREQIAADKEATENGLEEQVEKQIKVAQSVQEKQVALATRNQADAIERLDAWYLKQLAKTRTNSRAREKVEEEYAVRRAEIESDAALLVTQAEINLVKRLLKIKKDHNQETASDEKALAELEIELSDIVTRRKIANDEKERKSNSKKLNEYAQGLSEMKGVLDKAADLSGGIINAFTERNKEKIQEEIDAIDKKAEKDKEAVDATVSNQEEAEAKKKEIDLKAQSRKETLEARQRQLDLQRARFEKLRAVSDIVLNTAVGVTKALAALNFPLAFAIGAMGGAELIAALAQPLPKFKHGLTDSPGLFGVTGDGGRHEVLASPDLSQAMLTPATDTVTYIPKHWSVFPSVDAFHEKALSMGVPAITPAPGGNSMFDEGMLVSALMKGNGMFFNSLEKTIKNKQENHFHMKNGEWKKSVKNGSNWTTYINKNF